MLEPLHNPASGTYRHVKKIYFTFQKTYLKHMHAQTKLINTFLKNQWSIILYTE